MLPKYIKKKLDLLDSTNPASNRKRSGVQESRLAKQLKGVTAVNSGATFGQNDVLTDYCEIEAKTTSKKSFSVEQHELRKMEKKCALNKIPVFQVEFEETGNSFAVLRWSDLVYLFEQINYIKDGN